MLDNAIFKEHQIALELDGTTVVDATANVKRYCAAGESILTLSQSLYGDIVDLALSSKSTLPASIHGFCSSDGRYHGHWMPMGNHELLVVESSHMSNIHDHLLINQVMAGHVDDLFSVLPSFKIPSRELEYVELLINTSGLLKGVSLDAIFAAPYMGAFHDELLKCAFNEVLGLHDSLQNLYGASLPVAINVSSPQLENPSLLHALLDEAEQVFGPVGNHFIIELVEHHKPSSMINLRQGIDSIRERGVEVSLDDFTHGFAGLDWISHLRFDRVKFDMRVTQSIISNASNAQGFMDTFQQWARDYDFSMAAEGIESSTQIKQIEKFGFNSVQGFLLSGKIPLKDFPGRIQNTTAE